MCTLFYREKGASLHVFLGKIKPALHGLLVLNSEIYSPNFRVPAHQCRSTSLK